MPGPHRPADDEALATARALLGDATHGALATLPAGGPLVTRAGVLWLPGRGMGMLLSGLSDHTRALHGDPACALLLGEAPPRGDPLTHPRITLRGAAAVADKAALRDAWLAARPKARLYLDLPDFAIWCLEPREALLVAGFGRAHRLSPEDLGLPPAPPRDP